MNEIEQLDLYLRNHYYKKVAYDKFEEFKREILSGPGDEKNKLFTLIDDIILRDENGQFIRELPVGKPLFRARKIEVSHYGEKGLDINKKGQDYTTVGYNEQNSRECPIGYSGAGRNNIPGMGYLYVAEDEATACAEIKTLLRSLISLARFEVMQPIKYIDFSTDDKKFPIQINDEYEMSIGRFMSLLMFEFCHPVDDIESYRSTQIIADYLRKTGIDGIAYRSFYTWKTNYTIFNSHPTKIKYVDSRILSHHYSTDVFWDFNNNTEIVAEWDEEKEFDKSASQELLRDLRRAFSQTKKNKTV